MIRTILTFPHCALPVGQGGACSSIRGRPAAMTARKRARRVDTEQISAEERELRWLEGGDPVVQPAQPAWTTGAAAGAAPARLVLAVVVLIITGVSLACGDARRLAARPVERQADRMRTRLNFREFFGNMTEKEFSRYYRIFRGHTLRAT